jgi:energy-coupling factor transporter ATP-binding protein EcfA2
MGEYSGGMKRRVDLASALVHLPQVLFLDEPTEGLDPRGRSAIWTTLAWLRETLGMTIVLTTHYMEEADRLCDRIAIVDRGRLPALDRADPRGGGMTTATWLLTRRTLTQFPRNPMAVGFSLPPVLMMFVVFGALFESVKHLPGFPTDNYFEYLAPAAVLMTTVPGIANAAVGLATDFQSRYLYKLLTMPVSIGSIMAGRLLADGTRLFIQGGAVLLLAIVLGAQIASGFAGALLMLLLGTVFGIVTFGVLTANLALKSKDPHAVQAVFPMAFLLIFLTTAYQTEEQVPSGVLRTVIGANPTEYVLRAMRDLTLTGFEWDSIALAFLVIAGLGLVGIPLTIRNYRSVYR